jgi:hypothetical protein
MTWRDRLYNWLAARFNWPDRFTSFLYLGPEWLDRPRYRIQWELDKKIDEIRHEHLDDGAEWIEPSRIQVRRFEEQGGREVVQAVVDFEVLPRGYVKRAPS